MNKGSYPKIKIYEKHGGRFLWGKHQEDQLEKTMTKLKEDKIKLDNISYDDEELMELKKLEKKKKFTTKLLRWH